MPPLSSSSPGKKANKQSYYSVSSEELPLHCPTENMSLWNSHPRVFLPIEETGEAVCPYCGARYVLKKTSD